MRILAIRGFNRLHFEKLLQEWLTPTRPIRSAEFLRGREQKLEEVRRALVAPGRHIFVHGDRGVGKTSLAQTAAFEHQSADQEPVLLTCDSSSSFYRIAVDLANALLGGDPTVTKRSASRRTVAAVGSYLSVETLNLLEKGQVPEFRSINEVVGAIDFLAKLHSKAPVAVIDEFERVGTADDRMLFADFIKQLDDRTKNSLAGAPKVFISYQRIMASRKTKAPLSREKFNQRMNALKKPASAMILRASRTGWYEFAENIIRGYVRLRAEDQGIELEVDHQLMARRYVKQTPAR